MVDDSKLLTMHIDSGRTHRLQELSTKQFDAGPGTQIQFEELVVLPVPRSGGDEGQTWMRYATGLDLLEAMSLKNFPAFRKYAPPIETSSILRKEKSRYQGLHER